MSLNDFKKDITDIYKDDLVNIVRKYLINGSSYFFNLDKIEDDEYNIKNDISRILNIHPNNIIIVGSAKLGYSIKPDFTNRESLSYNFHSFRFDFDSKNNIEESDIDIAIIDSNLFEQKIQHIYEYLRGYDLPIIFEKFDDCRTKRYYINPDTGKKHNKKCFDDFSKYMLMGWLRPDKMPKEYDLFPELEQIRNKYNKLYNRKINIGIYKSWFYFEEYNIQNLKKIQQTINLKGLNDE